MWTSEKSKVGADIEIPGDPVSVLKLEEINLLTLT